MKIPVDTEHSRNRKKKFGPDGCFDISPAPRPEIITAQADTKPADAANNVTVSEKKRQEAMKHSLGV